MDAIDSLLNGVRGSFESDSYFGSLFCDLTKAFDCVPHSLLLSKLKFYGFDDTSTMLLKSYLSDRFQLVSIDGSNSSSLPVKHGVPQGSILGPLLFLIHINDLPCCVNAQFTLFADDTTVSLNDSDLPSLRRRLGEVRSVVEDWFAANGLTLNPAKSRTMLFTLKHPARGGPSAEGVKFLGVMLDSRLAWSLHGDYTVGRLSGCTFLLRSLKDLVSDRMIIKVYFALFDSVLRYGILAWGHSPILGDLFALQRRAIRIVTGTGYRSCCRGRFRTLKILTLPSLYIFECLKWMHANKHQFITNSGVHGRRLRYGDHIRIPYHRVYASRCGKSYYGPLLYNLLSDNVKSYGAETFAMGLKRFLAARAYYSLSEFIEDHSSFVVDF